MTDKPPKISSSEITPARFWLLRREFLTMGTAIAIGTSLSPKGYAAPLAASNSDYSIPDN